MVLGKYLIIVRYIEQEKDLTDFCITKRHKKGIGHAIVDAIILEPNISGIGFSFNNLKEYLGNKKV